MALDTALIDRIVANVLDQLQPRAATRRESAATTEPTRVLSSAPMEAAVQNSGRILAMPATFAAEPKVVTPAPQAQAPVSAIPVAAAPKAAAPTAAQPSAPAVVTNTAVEVGLMDAVITAATLEGLKLPSGAQVIVSPKSILTPSAHDWLRQRNVIWRKQRSTPKPGSNAPVGQWQLLASSVPPMVRSLLDTMQRSHPDWRTQLTGSAAEVVEQAVRLLTTGEVNRLLVTSTSAELIACRANRHERIRAVVVQSAEQLRTVEPELSPNLVVVNPQARSLMELRHLVQTCSGLGPAQVLDWK